MQQTTRSFGPVELPAVLLLFSSFLVLGIVIHQDYGLSWDEQSQHINGGLVPYEYIRQVWEQKHISPYPSSYSYGPVFSLGAVALEKLLGLTDTREIYLLRHLLNFLLFFLSTLCFYALCKRIFEDWRYGFLGVLFLITSPRIFAHAFYNPKDLPFMSLSIVAMFTLVRLLDHLTVPRALLHGVACALVVDMRIPGLFIPGLTGLFLLAELIRPRRPHGDLRKICPVLAAFLVAFSFCAVLFWPRLWHMPLGGFTESYTHMGNYPSKETVLYFGEHVSRMSPPWHYIPVWIGITTPPLYLVLFGVGLAATAVGLAKKSTPVLPAVRDLLLGLSWLMLPWVVIVVKGSTLYDGWRHLYFIYPGFLILCLVGVRTAVGLLRRHTRSYLREHAPMVVGVTILLGVLDVTAFMVRNHPYQNTYFNLLIGGPYGAKGFFDLDYWGTSYRQGLEYILEADPSETITVTSPHFPGQLNLQILTPEQRLRLRYTKNAAAADYFLSCFKYHPQEYPLEPFAGIEVDGAKILGIYKLPVRR